MTQKYSRTESEMKTRVLFIVGGVGAVLLLGLVGGVAWALYKSTLSALRWWAALATLASVVGPLVGFALGHATAESLKAGITHGVDTVMNAASRTAALRVHTAQAVRRRPAPQPGGVAYNVYLPPTAGALPGSVLPALNVAGADDNVDLF